MHLQFSSGTALSKRKDKMMLKLREATTTELGRWYSALETDFDRRELLPLVTAGPFGETEQTIGDRND